MNRVHLFVIGFVILAASAVDVSTHAHAAPPPVEAFGQLPKISNIRLSPDGRKFAALQSEGGRLVVAVYDLYVAGPPKMLAVDKISEKEVRIRFIRWANKDRLIVSISVPGKRFGTEVIETRLISLKADFSDIRRIPDATARSFRRIINGRVDMEKISAQIQDRIIHYLPNDPDHILLLYNRDGFALNFQALKVNVNTGTYSMTERSNDDVVFYEADNRGAIRIRYIKDLSGWTLQYRLRGERSWEQLYRIEEGEDDPYDFIGFVPGEANKIYIRSHDEKTRGVIGVVDLEAQEIVGTKYSHPTVDIDGLVYDRQNAVPVGYSFSEHQYTVKYFDIAFESILGRAAKRFSGYDVSIESSDKLRKKFILKVSRPESPPTYYLYMLDHDLFQNIAESYPGLAAAALYPMEPMSFRARDGLTIPGYLTRPMGQGPFPTVILPHGGPTSRNYLEFDYWVQFLASRGYAVLQPNFRGSSGYGLAFQAAGYQEWGLAMQDDVTDGVKHLIDIGVADPDRVCIVGGSYGGYVALIGAAMTPNLFQCAVAFAPITDIRLMLSNEAKFRFQDTNRPSVGSKYGDSSKLKDTSPTNRAEEIMIPILLTHGDKDRVVSIEHSRKMAKRLKRKKKEYRFIKQKDGDHYLSLEHHRIQFLREMESFLAEHLQ